MLQTNTKNELTIYAILCQNVTTFYRQELSSLFHEGKFEVKLYNYMS